MSGFIPHSADDIHDIKGIPLDHFWRKCEEFLPTGWWLTLESAPYEGKRVYRAMAWLYESPTTNRPMFSSPSCLHPERALEQLFYQLRDFL